VNYPVTVSVPHPSSCLEGSNNLIKEFTSCVGVCDTTDETLVLVELLCLEIMVRCSVRISVSCRFV